MKLELSNFALQCGLGWVGHGPHEILVGWARCFVLYSCAAISKILTDNVTQSLRYLRFLSYSTSVINWFLNNLCYGLPGKCCVVALWLVDCCGWIFIILYL